jgi:hypothetical protein
MRDMMVCFLLRHMPGPEVLLGYKKRGFEERTHCYESIAWASSPGCARL